MALDDLDPKAPYVDLWWALGPPAREEGFFRSDQRLRFTGDHRQPSAGIMRHPGFCDELRAMPSTAVALVWNAVGGIHSFRDASDRGNCSKIAMRVWHSIRWVVTIELPVETQSPRCPVVWSGARQRMVAVPYPTHFRKGDPERLHRHVHMVLHSARDHLFSYFASIRKATSTASFLRHWLHQECNRSSQSICSHSNESYSHVSGYFAADARIQHAYLDSVFCLQPSGDTPTRQGIFDALICGCIPVFFADCLSADLAFETMYHPFLPAFRRSHFGVGSWAVLLNATALLLRAGELHKQLLAIDPRHIQQMRRSIAGLIPRLLYIHSRPLPNAMVAESAHSVLSAVLREREEASRQWWRQHRAQAKFEYRLGDLVLQTGWRRPSLREVQYRPLTGSLGGLGAYTMEHFPHSIGASYVRAVSKWESSMMTPSSLRQSKQLVFTLLEEHRLRFGFKRCAASTLVVHLRLGDVIDYPQFYGTNKSEAADWKGVAWAEGPRDDERTNLSVSDFLDNPGVANRMFGGAKIYVLPRSYYRSLRLPAGLSQVVVAGSSRDGLNRLHAHNVKSLAYAAAVADVFAARGLRTVLRLDGEADEDLAYMSSARHFVQGGGSYSQLVADLVRYKGGTVYPFPSAWLNASQVKRLEVSQGMKFHPRKIIV